MDIKPDLVGILQSQGRTLTGTARLLGVSPHHLRHAAKGRVHARPEVREGLEKLLGEPISELLPAEALEAPYDPRRAEARLRRLDVAPWTNTSPASSTPVTRSRRAS
jgi:hypothetical protein